jgi:hypothetical protein
MENEVQEIRKKLNDRLARVQVGRDEEVPLTSHQWIFWIDETGDWDSESLAPSNWRSILESWIENPPLHVFVVWQGAKRTDLFLMDKKRLWRIFEDATM